MDENAHLIALTYAVGKHAFEFFLQFQVGLKQHVSLFEASVT
jgi:hypothetical protein